MTPVWQGSCNQWDCDEMGHMNVRVYLEKQVEGLANFSHTLAMPHAFQANGPSTLLPVDQHVRFVREVMPGRPLSMTACVIEVGDTDALIYQEMRHGDGSLAASFQTRVAHVEAKSGKPFAWSQRSRAAMNTQMGTVPAEAAPRSIDMTHPGIPMADATYDLIQKVNAPRIGLGAVPAAHLDVHGRMAPFWFMGRVSDSVPNLLYDWRQKVASAAGSARMGAAVLEYRLRYHRWPKAGARFEIHSSLGQVQGKTHALVHWVMDPATGRPWVTSQATAITLDLDARKAIPAPPEMIADLERIAPKGLRV